MQIPTEADWRSEPWCLDAKHAYGNFRGKSLEEAIKLFEANSLCYQEDVLFMPKRVFPYYVRAYMAYLMSEAAKGDSDGASAFIGLIQFKAEFDRETLVPLWPEVEPLLRKLAEEQDYFDAEWTTYGSFRSGIREIVERGFEVSFETLSAEFVPDYATLQEMRYGNHSLSWPVAIHVLRNSGFEGLDETSTKEDIFRVFGLPEKEGGEKHPEFGHIADWVRYKFPEFYLHFRFAGELVVALTIMPLNDPIWGTPP